MSMHSIEIVTPSEEQRWNDAAILSAAPVPHFRVWLYRESAIVLGCAQAKLMPARSDVNEEEFPILMRRSGGGAVLVGPWLVSISAWIPSGHKLLGPTLAGSYRWLGEAHVAALHSLGVLGHARPPASLDGAGTTRRPTSVIDWACFGSVSAWEVVDACGRKLSGFAQIRRRAGALFVGATLVWKSPWDLMCSRLGRGNDNAIELRRRTISCGELTDDRSVISTFPHAISRELRERIVGSDPCCCLQREVEMT